MICWFYPNLYAEHVLDWFHLTMRITILSQYAKGVVRLDEKLGEEIREDFQRVKWYCWHGNVYESLEIRSPLQHTPVAGAFVRHDHLALVPSQLI